MKKNQKKGKFLLGALVGVVALGVGYATITNVTLNINGSATALGSAQQSDFVVRFVQSSDSEHAVTAVSTAATNPASYTVVTGSAVEASASITSDTEATFNVDKMVAGDEVRFTYYVTNLSNDLGAKITPNVTNEYTENFEVTVNPNEEINLAENEVQEITVTVKCIAQDLLDTTGTFTVSFTAEATE